MQLYRTGKLGKAAPNFCPGSNLCTPYSPFMMPLAPLDSYSGGVDQIEHKMLHRDLQ